MVHLRGIRSRFESPECAQWTICLPPRMIANHPKRLLAGSDMRPLTPVSASRLGAKVVVRPIADIFDGLALREPAVDDPLPDHRNGAAKAAKQDANNKKAAKQEEGFKRPDRIVAGQERETDHRDYSPARYFAGSADERICEAVRLLDQSAHFGSPMAVASLGARWRW